MSKPTAEQKKTAQSLLLKGSEAYFDDEFGRAEDLYTQAIASDSTDGDIYLKRAQTRQKLGKEAEAAADALQASKLLVNNSEHLRQYFSALFIHGKLATELKNYDEAADSLRKALVINPSHKNIIALLEKVEPLTTPKPAPVVEEEKKEEEPAKPTRPQVRHEWYQNDDFVILEVFIKRVQKEAASVEFSDKSASLSIKMATGSENNYEFEPLLHEIVPGESTFEVLSTKIEIRMKKANGGLKWDHLEETEAQQAAKNKQGNLSTSRKGISWDAIAADAEKETKLAPSDQGVNELFQSIYKDADEDTKRAMMKSYIESNGTALSTDWKSVSKGPVETSPPVDTYAKPYKR